MLACIGLSLMQVSATSCKSPHQNRKIRQRSSATLTHLPYGLIHGNLLPSVTRPAIVGMNPHSSRLYVRLFLLLFNVFLFSCFKPN
ncbi:hypothetical protein IF2G_02208 [Cordyceps javanica]|nr:hypothetical protein IF2G_02208 [Cordyceps javanica]